MVLAWVGLSTEGERALGPGIVSVSRTYSQVKGEQFEKFVAEPAKDARILGSGGEEFNPRPETRLDCSEFLCNKVLLKNKEI